MSIYKQPKSPYWFIRLSDRSGGKIRRSTGTTDRAEAQKYFEREQQRIWQLNKLGDSGAHTFREAAARWLSETEKDTKDRDEERLAWFLSQPELTDAPLSSITIDVIQELRKLCGDEERAKGTVNRYMAVLRAVMRKAAFEWKWLDHPPKVPMYSMKNRPDAPWLTHAQFDKLHAELPPHLKLAAEFAVLTGLRMRAMTGLTWDRVDLRAKRAWVPKSGQKSGFNFGVALSRDALLVLRKCKTANPDGDHVFQYNGPQGTMKGRPVDDCNGQAYIKAVRRAALPEEVNWHTLRHTWASWAVQGGVTLQQLMVLGDWRSYAMVLKYAHLCPDAMGGAANLVTRKGHTARKRHTGSK